MIIADSVFLLKPLGTSRLQRDSPRERHTFTTGIVNFLISMRQKDKVNNMRRQTDMLQIKDIVRSSGKKKKKKTTTENTIKPTRKQVTIWK